MTLNKTTAPRLFAAALALAVPAVFAAPSLAQTAPKKNIAQRHPMATGVVAAMAAHHMAKKGAKARMASGRKPNLAERHPVMSGLAAGAVAHHMAKKAPK
jgi:hypothetical protein